MNENSPQYEAEQLLYSTLKYGDESKLAKALNVSVSEISQQVNPNEPRKSDFFKFRRFLTALCTVNPYAARLLVSDLNSIVEKPNGRRGDLSRLAGDVAQESTEFIISIVRNKPVHVQRKELLDVQAIIAQTLAHLDGEVARKKDRVAVMKRRVAELQVKTG